MAFCGLYVGILTSLLRGDVTKGHVYHLLGVSDYYVMYRYRAQSGL